MDFMFLLIIVTYQPTFAINQLIDLTWRFSAKPLLRPLTREESCLKLLD